MIAKIIAKGSTRDRAGYRLQEAVQRLQVWPVKTNAAFLAQCLLDEDVTAGDVDTGLIERKADVLTCKPSATGEEIVAGVLQLLAFDERDPLKAPLVRVDGSPGWRGDAGSRLNPLFGFRLNSPSNAKVQVLVDGVVETVDFGGGLPDHDRIDHSVFEENWSRLRDGFARHYDLNLRAEVTGHHAHDGDILSPMPGRIIAVEVTHGQAVTKGQKLLTLEAMKMEHSLTAPFDGVVAELNAETGAQVQVEALLVRIDAAQA